MENVTISIEIVKDSEIYKAASAFSAKYGVALSIFSTPEKVLEHCIIFGINPYISDNMKILSLQADAYIKKHNND